MYTITRLFIAIILGWSTLVVLAQSEAELPSAATAEVVHFDITDFQVEGNTLLSTSEVATLLTPYAGSSRDFSDVQHALEALENAYHNRGYTAVQVYLPEQELMGGVVRLAVIETRIHKILIEDNHYFDSNNIRASFPSLRENEPFNLRNISTNLRLANENPAKKLTLEMQAIDNEDQVNARIKVRDENPWRISLNVDNTGTPQSGRNHYGIALQHANVANLDHVLTLQYTTSSEGPEVSIYGISYHLPLYQFGDSIDMFGGYSDVDSGSINGTPITGRGSIFGARYNQDLGRNGNYTQRLIYGVDYRDYQGIPLPGNLEAVHPITILPLSLGYTGTWTLPTATTTFTISAFRNLPSGNHGSDYDFLTAIHISRATVAAAADYAGLRYAASLNYTLPTNWMLRAAFTGQYSRDALISGEQIGLAGANAVRGFPERDVASDRGHFTNLEMYTPDLCAGLWESNCRLLAFLDNGQGYSLGNGDVAIGSVGLGLRWLMGKTLNMDINGAQVLDAGGSQQNNDRYLHFQMGVNF